MLVSVGQPLIDLSLNALHGRQLLRGNDGHLLRLVQERRAFVRIRIVRRTNERSTLPVLLLDDLIQVELHGDREALAMLLLDVLGGSKALKLAVNHDCKLGAQGLCLFHGMSRDDQRGALALLADGLPELSA